MKLGEVKRLFYGHTAGERGSDIQTQAEGKACMYCLELSLAVGYQALRSIRGLCLSTEQPGLPRRPGTEPYTWLSRRAAPGHAGGVGGGVGDLPPIPNKHADKALTQPAQPPAGCLRLGK